MGLDISVYSNIELVKSLDDLKNSGVSPEDIDRHHDDYVYLYVNPSFKKQADGLVTGFYKGNSVTGFRAGSYSGYSYFRDRLSRLALDVDVGQVWNNIENFSDKPFVDLLNFSDCEGCIGPETSAKLYKDFESFLPKAKTLPKESEYDYFLDVYLDFMNAFLVASTGNGVVSFH